MNEEEISSIREQLRTREGVNKLRKALKNRGTRWWLKRQGALDLVQSELLTAEKALNSSENR